MELLASWRRLALVLVVGLLVTPASRAGEAAPVASAPLALELDQAIAMALDRSPALRAVTYKARAADEKASAAGRTHWGRLDAVASVTRFDEDRLLVPMSRQLLSGGLPGAPFDRDQVHYGLTYRVPLYLGGRLSADIEIARLEAARTEALRAGTSWQVRYNVVSLYAGVQALDGAVRSAGELVETLTAVRKRLQLMVDNGKRPAVDLLKVEDELAEAEARKASLQARRTRVAGALLSLLGENPGRPLTVAPLPDDVPELAVPPDSLRAMALASSAVRRARLARRQADSGIKAARAEFLPSIAFQADYMAHHAGSLDGDDLTTWQLSLGVKWPLFTGASRFAALAAAKAGRRAADENLKLARLRREADLNDALARFQAARTGLEAARARVTSATEAARIEQIRYDSGASSIEDLLRARTREEAAHTALARATGELRSAAERINTVVEMEVIR